MHNQGPKRARRSPKDSSDGNGPGGKTRLGGATPDGDRPRVVLTKNLTVKELAEALALKDTAVIKGLFLMGHMRTIHQIVEQRFAKQLAISLGYEVIDSETDE